MASPPWLKVIADDNLRQAAWPVAAEVSRGGKIPEYRRVISQGRIVYGFFGQEWKSEET